MALALALLSLAVSVTAIGLLGRPGPAVRPVPLPALPASTEGLPRQPDLGKSRVSFTLPIERGRQLAFRPIVVTGYTSCPRETDSTPHVTASLTRVRPGCLALSRDLLRTFTPGAPFDFGDWVVLAGVGVFVVEDTMNARWRNRADIWFQERRMALRWGRRRALIARLPLPLEGDGRLFALGPRVEGLR
jgi:3D (Asp-Asp-Asp) domain-containing protein